MWIRRVIYRVSPNAPAQACRANGVRLSTETRSRRCLQPACSAIWSILLGRWHKIQYELCVGGHSRENGSQHVSIVVCIRIELECRTTTRHAPGGHWLPGRRLDQDGGSIGGRIPRNLKPASDFLRSTRQVACAGTTNRQEQNRESDDVYGVFHNVMCSRRTVKCATAGVLFCRDIITGAEDRLSRRGLPSRSYAVFARRGRREVRGWKSNSWLSATCGALGRFSPSRHQCTAHPRSGDSGPR